MGDFKKINEARKLLELEENASLEEIKKSYRRLSLKYHPDRCKEEDKKNCEEMFKKINHAMDVIENYCIKYKISFKEPDARKRSMDKETYEHIKRFYDGWF